MIEYHQHVIILCNTSISFDQHPRLLGDVNLDGRVEIIGFKDGEIHSIDISIDEVIALDALIHPNPVIASNFIDGNSINLGFYMANASEFELYIYDMFGQLRLKKFYDLHADYAGSNAYNFIDIDYADFNGDVSAGAYFFVMVSNDTVVGQGKFGVRP